jgi:pre-mRNA-splicing factor SYF2
MEEKRQKLKLLKEKRKISQELNKKIIQNSAEVEAKESMKIKRKRQEAQDLLMEKELNGQGIDVERVKNLKYSIEETEKWNEKLMEKEERKDSGFTDFAQVAAKKYRKTIKDFKPNLKEYEEQKTSAGFYRDANDLQYGTGQKPNRQQLQRLTQEIENQNITRGKFSKRRAYNDNDEVTFINERNMRFNKKVNRAYDKYTTEIKANLERGTAL